MTEKIEQLLKIILRTFRNEATEDDKATLEAWLNSSRENRFWLDQFEDDKWVASELAQSGYIDVEAGKQKIRNKIAEHKRRDAKKRRTGR